MNTFTIILDITFIITIGYLIGNKFLFLKKYSFLKKFALSYLLGFGFVGFQMFFYSLIGIKWNLVDLTLPWLIIIIFAIFRNWTEISTLRKRSITIRSQFGRIEKILFLLLILLIVFVGVQSILRPIQAWDGWDNWVLRSNVFYINKDIDPYYFKYTTDSYPLIIPLTVSFGYISMGKIDDRTILLFYYMFYASLGILFYSTVKDLVGRKKSLLFTFLLLSTQNIIRHGGRFEAGQADLAVGVYIFAGAIILYEYIKTKSVKTLLLLSILIGIGSQIKNDILPFIGLALLVVIFDLVKRKKYKDLLFLLPFVFLFLPWEIYKKVAHLHPSYLLKDGINLQFSRVPEVLLAMSREFVNFKNWNLLWFIFFISLIFFHPAIKKYWLFILIIAIQLLAYLTVFLFTPADPVGQINAVANKLYLHIAPIAVLLIAVLTQGFRNKA